MGTTAKTEAGDVACSRDGCGRPARSQRKPGLCHACQARECYHRKNPDAERLPPGHRGRWKGVLCACGQPVHCVGLCVQCYRRQYTPPVQTPQQNRARRIKHRYGITQQQYDEMVAARDNLCDVCGQLPSEKNTRAHWNGKLCIDHCHDTKRVRGLLCNDCNLAVGYGRTPDVLTRAAEYLRRNA